MRVWISSDFLKYDHFSEGSNGGYRYDYVRKPMDILIHAEELFEKNEGKEYYSDAILNINRAIDLRLKQIFDLYKLRTVEWLKKYKDWDKLEKLGIVRKFYIEEINRVRNKIEHEYVNPPSRKIIRYYIEFCWYFIKATNRLCETVEGPFLFEEKGKGSIECYLQYDKKWKIRVHGGISEKGFSLVPCKNYYEVSTKKLERGAEINKRWEENEKKLSEKSKNYVPFEFDRYNDSDFIFDGLLQLTDNEYADFYRTILVEQ